MSTITGQVISKALRGSWHGGQGMCVCPAHKDDTPSLHVVQQRSGPILVKCFAGCDNLTVIRELRALGLWPARDEHGYSFVKSAKLRDRSTPDIAPDDVAKMDQAREIWRVMRPVAGTPAELYLLSRAIDTIKRPVPPSLGFAERLFHREAKKFGPALIGAIQNSQGRVTAVQRIWISDKWETSSDGAPPKGARPNFSPIKKTQGPIGDGAIRLGKAGRHTGIAEGIESGYAAQQRYSIPVWVACGAWRMGRVALPEIVQTVVIFADAGAEGERAASKAADEFYEQGFDVDIIPPSPGFEDHSAEAMHALFGRIAA